MLHDLHQISCNSLICDDHLMRCVWVCLSTLRVWVRARPAWSVLSVRVLYLCAPHTLAQGCSFVVAREAEQTLHGAIVLMFIYFFLCSSSSTRRRWRLICANQRGHTRSRCFSFLSLSLPAAQPLTLLPSRSTTTDCALSLILF